MVGLIREAEKGFHCILYAKIHKIHREHGWAYLACKKCGRIAKEADVGMKLWNCTGARGDVKTPLLKSGSSSKFSSSDVVPFSIEETPKSKGVTSSKGESSSSGSGKQAIVDLDDYNEEEEQVKKER
uniref:Replication protein A 70 kDa DNA-binding subunit B n=1 Tax=Tanacetum cinerariifolium TaxID=118510 RepID=A0A6L2P2K6_TANCI|nr:replication protein A 70 kDa DNA-binding subunit B [Tanacetum cinerariifolium]